MRVGNIIEFESEGRLCEVVKQLHNHGSGRQLGNVQVCPEVECHTLPGGNFTCANHQASPEELFHIGNSLCLCAQLELRDLARGNKVHGRWRPSDPIEVVRLDTKAYQYLYAEGAAHWMQQCSSCKQGIALTRPATDH